MFNLKIIIVSTRPGRKGPLVGAWTYEAIKDHPAFKVSVVDLAEIDLPMMNEPNHPRMKKYQHQHTLDWSNSIEEADAFIIVTPEYNFGYPAPIKNALDYLFHEWSNKPVAFVSYGGVAGGTRSVQMLKQVVSAFNMMALSEAVHIPFFAKLINDQNQFDPGQTLDKSVEAMMTALTNWTEALNKVRGK